MRVDLTQELLLPRLQVIVYLLAAFALTILLLDQYRQGLYPLVLTNAIAMPVFLFSAIFIYINIEKGGYQSVNYVLVFVLSGLALYQLSNYPVLMTHYLFALPLFCYFALPLKAATIANMILALALIIILIIEKDITYALRTGTNFFLLFGSAWCFAYLTVLKGYSLRQLALTDPFSRAYNRRHFLQAMERELARAQSARQNVSLIGLLIDDYQQLIDIHGNQVMMKFLPGFVEKTQKMIRAGDDVFRLNDDLFVLLLPNCPEDGAVVLMERVKRNLQQHGWNPFAEVSLSAVAFGVDASEYSRDIERRLLSRLRKQKRTNLQLSAFGD